MVKPSRADYLLALQNPHTAFRESELRDAQTTRTPLGLPNLMSGNFAVVCHLYLGDKAWAVRAFYKDVPGVHHRYSVISAYLEPRRAQSSTIVGFRYVSDGILVNGSWHPIVVMDWVPGVQLDRAIDERITQGRSLAPLADAWLALVQEIESLGIAHGDLQHGNVLVDGDRLRLVDYDGMFVPAMAGMTAAEQGHPNFQHPRRGSHGFNAKLDHFSSVLIYTAIRALEHDPALWVRHGMRDDDGKLDDAVLFRKADLIDPGASNVFRDLATSGDMVVQHLASALMVSLDSGDPPLPLSVLLDDAGIVDSPVLGSTTDVTGWWRQKQSSDTEPLMAPTPNHEPVGAGWLRAYIPTQVEPGDSVNSRESSPGLSNKQLRWLKSTSALLASERVFFVASRSGRTIHLNGCEMAKRISPKSLIAFDTLQHAYAAGYAACKVCAPDRNRQPANQLQINSQHPPTAAVDTGVVPPNNSKPQWSPAKVEAVLKSPVPRETKSIAAQRPKFPNARVEFGSVVKLQHSNGDVEVLRLVRAGSRQSGTFQVAEDTSLGRAILGAYLGDSVDYQQLGRTFTVKIIDIE